MSYVKIETNRSIPYKMQFVSSTTHFISNLLCEDDKEVMISIHDNKEMYLAKRKDATAFIQLKCNKLPEECNQIIKSLESYLESSLRVKKERICIECCSLNNSSLHL